MAHSEIVEIRGHLIDTAALSKVLNDIAEYGGDYVVEQFDIGHGSADPSYARINVSAAREETLQRILMRLQIHGVNQVDPGEAQVDVADMDGVFPDGFYSSTNLETQVRLDGHWVRVRNPEMDCGLVVLDGD
ncbi:MAG: bifunctional enzyme conserved domain protein, partial [Marmoricola sp.]|nr:bifunctional enzyme conserved domain protein [Marmoricola sp.]